MTARLLRRTRLRLVRTLHACWRRWCTDDSTRYLAQSVDHVDLACRIQRWNEVERHDRMPLL